MGFFGKSIEEKILDMALLAIDEDKPVKDKFLIFYRVCQFDLSFSFKNDEEEKLLTKYKNEPIYPKQYKGVKSHLKAIYVVMMEISFFIARSIFELYFILLLIVQFSYWKRLHRHVFIGCLRK